MTEEEIMIRAREASIAAGYTRGLGITEAISTKDERAIRAGDRDRNWSILCAARALRDLSKPLSEIQPIDPDLIEARSITQSRGWQFQPDDAPMVRFALAAIKRGRALASQEPEE